MLRSLVGSEMCIRDSHSFLWWGHVKQVLQIYCVTETTTDVGVFGGGLRWPAKTSLITVKFLFRRPVLPEFRAPHEGFHRSSCRTGANNSEDPTGWNARAPMVRHQPPRAQMALRGTWQASCIWCAQCFGALHSLYYTHTMFRRSAHPPRDARVRF